MARYLPRDWPEGVQPPGSQEWEATAVTWLLDLVPEYRQYPVVRRLMRTPNDGVLDV